MSTTNLVCCVLTSFLLSAAAGARDAPPQDRGPAKPYLISGQIVSGWIVSCDEDGFTIRVASEGDDDGILVRGLSWDTLSPADAKRIRAERLPRKPAPPVTVRVERVPAECALPGGPVCDRRTPRERRSSLYRVRTSSS